MIEPFDLRKPQQIPFIKRIEKFDNSAVFEPYLADHEHLRYFATTTDEIDSYFMKLVTRGWIKEQIPEARLPEYIEELETELRTIHLISENKGVHMADYFTTMAKLMDIIMQNKKKSL